MSWTTEPLDPRHDRSGFSCGQPSLDDFLAKLAGQYQKRHLGRTRVLVRDGQPRVFGYHTLAASELRPADLPPILIKGLPRHPLPAALLGRLAVDQSVRGQGLGTLLLTDALGRIVAASNTLAIALVVVDALDEGAATFYERFGFVRLPSRPGRLVLPTANIRTGPAS